MKKQKKQFLLLVIVLVVFVGAYFGADAYVDFAEQKKAEQELLDKVYVTNLEAAQVQAITYDYSGGTYSFVKQEDTWVYGEDSSLSIIQSYIEAMAQKAAQMEAQSVIREVTELAQYGLEEPSETIRFTAGDDEYELWVGDYNSMSYVYYVCNAADTGVVYAVDGSALGSFNYALEDVIEEEETTETESLETETVEIEETETE